jgi:pimeloyl-ACP methyl ester carboxylesterase
MPAGLHYVETDGGRLAVEITGKETDPLVICSPGMGDTRDAYEPFAKILVSHGYRVATVDARGHGESSTGFGRYGDEATDGSRRVQPWLARCISRSLILCGGSDDSSGETARASQQDHTTRSSLAKWHGRRWAMADASHVRMALGTDSLGDVCCDVVARTGK